MTKTSACSVPSCSTSVLAKGLCSRHYQVARTYVAPLKACKGCGAELVGRGGHEYCRPECRPRCVVANCSEPAERSANSLCLGHSAQKVRYGIAKPYKFRWKEPSERCLTCGEPTNAYRLRSFCRFACYQLWVKYDGNVPATKPCVACGDLIDLFAVGKGGQRKHRVVAFCQPCGDRRTKYNGANVRQLAQRDGTDCALCGRSIDMTIRRNHAGGEMCASVDHIVPQSKGGTHDLTNLQLAHLLCNLRKSDRIQLPHVEVVP